MNANPHEDAVAQEPPVKPLATPPAVNPGVPNAPYTVRKGLADLALAMIGIAPKDPPANAGAIPQAVHPGAPGTPQPVGKALVNLVLAITSESPQKSHR